MIFGKVFIEGKSTLADMYQEISMPVRPFVTLNIVDQAGEVLISNTIPNAVFEVDPYRPELMQIMNNNGSQVSWVAIAQMVNYVYTRGTSFIQYIFTITVS